MVVVVVAPLSELSMNTRGLMPAAMNPITASSIPSSLLLFLSCLTIKHHMMDTNTSEVNRNGSRRFGPTLQ